MARPRDTARVVERPGPWQHRHVAANGARFHVAVSSPAGVTDPPLVLLLHGFPEFWWAWRHQLPALADAGYRAVAMDLRGYGGSDKTPRGYDPLTLARDVVGVVKALGERRAVVVGHGWGGYVGWVAATLHPKEISALCSVAAPHPRVMLRGMRRPGGAKATGHVLAMQLPMVPERRLARRESGYLTGHVRGWSGPESEFPDDATLATYQDAISLWPAAHCALEYHRWLFRSRFRYDGRHFDRLMQQSASQPVCLVRGDADPALPRPERDDSRAAVAGPVEEHVMRGAGHFPPEEQPEAFTDLLLGWLERTGRHGRPETTG